MEGIKSLKRKLVLKILVRPNLLRMDLAQSKWTELGRGGELWGLIIIERKLRWPVWILPSIRRIRGLRCWQIRVEGRGAGEEQEGNCRTSEGRDEVRVQCSCRG